MESETLQKWLKIIFLFSKFLLCTFLVNVSVMAMIRINENLFFLLIFLPSIFFLLANVYLFSFKIRRTVQKDEASMFTCLFICYGVILTIILMYDHEGNTLQNNSEINQTSEINLKEESENFSYSIKNSKTESEWEATENLSDNILKYHEDINEVKKNPILKSIYYSTLFLILVAIVFQGCAWAVANQINLPVEEMQEVSPQNEAILMQLLSPAMENTEAVTYFPPQIPSSSSNHSTHRRYLPIRNVFEPMEDSDELEYDSVPVAGPSSSAAGLK
ncbi:UNVERIFIED_CONTAM: hypothetical protein RMT77_019908 [Armadillidium vulgare]